MRDLGNTPKPILAVFRRQAEAEKQTKASTHHPHTNLQKYDRLNFRVAIVAIILALVSTGFAWVAMQDTKRALNQTDIALTEARAQFTQESLARAWEILGRPTPGNSGKIAALETLYHGLELDDVGRIPLAGIDFSCARMGGGWDAEEKTCARPTYLERLNLAGIPDPNDTDEWLRRANLEGADLSGAQLFAANLSGANLYNVNLSGALLAITNLSDVSLWRANLSGANFSDADLTDADLSDANLSNVKYLYRTRNLTANQIRTAFAFDDSWASENLPADLTTGPESDWPHPVLCPATLRAEDGTYEINGNIHEVFDYFLPVGCTRAEHGQKLD